MTQSCTKASRGTQWKDSQLKICFPDEGKNQVTAGRILHKSCVSRVPGFLIQLAGGKTHLSELGKLVLWEENVGLNIDTKCYNQNGI